MAGQVGLKSEATYGTPAGAVDQFVEVLASTLSTPDRHLRREGIRPRLTERPGRLGFHHPTGQVRMELQNVTSATLLKHMFGTINTTGSGPYTHTASPGPQVGSNKSFTLETGITDTADTTRPFTATGCKINSWELSVAVNEYAMLSFDWTGQKLVSNYRVVTDGVTTNADATITSATAAFTQADVGRPIAGTGIPAGATIASINSATSAELSANATASASSLTFTFGIALASASYAATIDPWTFVDATVTLGGSAIASARAATLRCSKNLRAERPKLGSRFGNEQLVEGRWEFTGQITADFENMTVITAAAAATQLALVMSFVNGNDTLTITSNVQIEGDTPSLSTNGLEEQQINFRVGHTGTDAQAITAVLVNADASAA